jgi:addiction module HigA family antidote
VCAYQIGGLSLTHTTLRSKNRKPTHPGAILREDVLAELKITQGELALRLGVSRRTISEILHERRPMTADIAIRFSTTKKRGRGRSKKRALRGCDLRAQGAGLFASAASSAAVASGEEESG